jgi:hypothetical protein
LVILAGTLACRPPMWRAERHGSANRVQRLVLVVRAKGCQCTRKDVAKAMRALGTVLGARRNRMVHQLDWDRDRADVQRYRSQRRFIALPALYFVDARGRVVGLLEGDIQPKWIRKLMR